MSFNSFLLGSLLCRIRPPNIVDCGGYPRNAVGPRRPNGSGRHDWSDFSRRTTCWLDRPSGHVAVGQLCPASTREQRNPETDFCPVSKLSPRYNRSLFGCWSRGVALDFAQTFLPESAMFLLFPAWRTPFLGCCPFHRDFLYVRHHRRRPSTSTQSGHVRFTQTTDDCRTRRLSPSKGILILLMGLKIR